MIEENRYYDLGKKAFSLKTKISLMVVIIILMILLSIGFLQIQREQSLHKEYIDGYAQTISKTILGFNVLGVQKVNYANIQRLLNRYLEERSFAEDIIFIALHDKAGNILAGSLNKNLVKSYFSERVVAGKKVINEIPIETSDDMKDFISKVRLNNIVEQNNNLTIHGTQIQGETRSEVKSVYIGYSTLRLNKLVMSTVVSNLVVSTAYIIIAIIASIFLGGAIAKPIKILENAMKRVSAGDLNQRLEISSKDEIGTLAATFNYMTEGLREKEKIKKEFLVAREVQFNLLPKTTLDHQHMDIATYFEPATEVGGDYYDFLEIDEDNVGVVIGDVSGHGMSAGLMMAITKSCLHTQMAYQSNLAKLMASMNGILYDLSEKRSMVTLFFAHLDFVNSNIYYANAGHPFTYLINGEDKSFQSLESVSYPLAVKKELKFKTRKASFTAGDYLLFYSDGIVEALDENGNVFGFERIEEILSTADYSTAQELLETLITEVRIHIGTAEQFDDITAVVVKIK